SGSFASGVTSGCYRSLVRIAHEAGAKVILDVRGEALRRSLEERPELVKINMEEAGETFTGGSNGSSADWSGMMERMYQAYGTSMSITDGMRDIHYWSKGVPGTSPVVPVKDPVNLMGCGDAFAAGLLEGVLAGEPLEEAIPRAAACAARNAGSIRPGSLD
ncbi:MAG: hypothetical protein E4H09_01720, partial [Spirochaetales bacterium]